MNPTKMLLQMSISDRLGLVLTRDSNARGFVEVSKTELADMHRAAVDKELELRRVERQFEKIATDQELELSRVETQFEKWKDILDKRTDGLNDQICRFAQIVMPQENQPPVKDWYLKEMARLRSAHHISPEFLVDTQPEGTSQLEEQVIAQPKEKQIAQVPQEAPVVQILKTATSSAQPPAKAAQKKKRVEGSNHAAKAPAGDENHMMRSIISICVLFATFIALSLIKLNQQYHIIPPIRRM
jgi:hypothetical protein